MVSATRPEQKRLISRKVPQWMSYRGKVVVWVDVRVVRAEVQEKVKAEAREDPATADRELVHRLMLMEAVQL